MFALDRDGAELHPGRAAALLPMLEAAFVGLDRAAPGTRLKGSAALALRPILSAEGVVGAIAAAALGAVGRPVRAILFDKNAATNWALGWHQDRVTCVAHRRDAPGFGGWTVKQGALHVSPPFPIIADMVTVRIHLDPVAAGNAPLLIAPGSHRFGAVREHEIADVVTRCGSAECLADAGDVWLYSTPILHASARAQSPARRRVLQVDFSASELPHGLEWAEI